MRMEFYSSPVAPMIEGQCAVGQRLGLSRTTATSLPRPQPRRSSALLSEVRIARSEFRRRDALGTTRARNAAYRFGGCARCKRSHRCSEPTAILIGIQLEERDLIDVFGDQYRRHRERVRML